MNKACHRLSWIVILFSYSCVVNANFSPLTKVDNTTDYPWVVFFQAIFKDADQNNECGDEGDLCENCSGILIDPRIVLTAGHCVYAHDFIDSSGKQHTINDHAVLIPEIIPAFSKDKIELRPFGAARGNAWEASSAWINGDGKSNKYRKYDVGYIFLERPVGVVTGTLPFGETTCSDIVNAGNVFEAVGYPKSEVYSGTEMYRTHGSFDGCSGELLYFNREGEKGQSGSGVVKVIDSSSTVEGVLVSKEKDKTYSAPITADVKASIDYWIGYAEPPTFDLIPLKLRSNEAGEVNIGKSGGIPPLSFLLHNYSKEIFNGTVKIDLYLSKDEIISSEDTHLEQISAVYQVGGKKTAAIDLFPTKEIPASVEEGAYWIGVIVSAGGGKKELVVNNNSTNGWDALKANVEFYEILYVDGEKQISGNGKSWSKAFNSIDAAVSAAVEGSHIWIKKGVYSRDDVTGELLLDRSLVLRGGFVGTETRDGQRNWKVNETVVDGGKKTLCFDIVANVTVDGFIIQNCSGEYGGGMIITPDKGVKDISPRIQNCRFAYNYASNAGGAIYIDNASPKIFNCQFIGNSAVSYGGAIHNYMAAPMITSSMFVQNSSLEGGAIAGFDSWKAASADPQIINSLFWSNIANMAGGAVYNVRSEPYIANSSFNGNQAKNGGAIFNVSSSPILKNLILWGDSPDEIGKPSGDTHAPVLSDSIIQQAGYAGTSNNINQDPYYEDADTGDLHLIYEAGKKSPAVDKGADVTGFPFSFAKGIVDLDDNPRETDGDKNGTETLDLGAYEYQAVIPKPVAQRAHSFDAPAIPFVSGNPVQAHPIGLGPAAEGGDNVSLRIALEQSSEPVDIYFGVSTDSSQWTLMHPDYSLQPLSAGFVPWRKNTKDSINVTLFDEIPVSTLTPGNYQLGLMITPSGNLVNYELWTTSFNTTPKEVDSPTVSNLEAPKAVCAGQFFRIKFDYSDPDGLDDVDEIHVLMSDGYQDILPAGGSGRFDLGGYFFENPGSHWIKAYVTDQAGNQSNVLEASITVVDCS